ncbi:MAG TPA: hypothetical protein VGU74_08830 [Gemmatimonadales bacterium]|nr:hypothetical protein [Gemmatimonadales bacterium]
MRGVLLCLLLVGCERGSGTKVALRFHPPPGAVYHHTFDQSTSVTSPATGALAGPSQDVHLRMYTTQTVKGPEAGGGTEVEIVVDSATMQMPGLPADFASRLARLRGTRSTVVFDDRSRVVRNDFPGVPGAPREVANQVAAVLKGMAYAFPEQPVARGDSWTVPMELPLEQLAGNASKAGPAQTRLSVREIRATGADTTVVLDVETTFPKGPVDLMVAGQRGTMSLSGRMTGYQEFSLSRGTVIEAHITGSSTVHITVASLGVRDMGVVTQTESSIRLVGTAGK